MAYQIAYSCACHIGRVRQKNQDNLVCDGKFIAAGRRDQPFSSSGKKDARDRLLVGVFDGMGGEECGEVASCIAAQRAAALKLTGNPAADLLSLCQQANAAICDYTTEHDLSSMGTTAAMLAFTGGGVTLCNIGDSKIFRFCGDELTQISKDHLAVAPFGKKPPLLQNLGIPPTELVIDPYLAQGGYREGDLYLICSDGLTDMVTTEEIKERLAAKKELEEAAADLLETALSHGGRDNVSIILCRVERAFGWPFGRRHDNRKDG